MALKRAAKHQTEQRWAMYAMRSHAPSTQCATGLNGASAPRPVAAESRSACANVLLQRFKDLEQRALGQSGSAHGLKLVDAQRSGLVGDEELRLTTAEMRARARLRNLPAIRG